MLSEFDFTSVATTALVGGVLLGASYLIKTSRKPSGVPPGPARVPIVGNVALRPVDGTSFNTAFQDLCKKFGPIFSMYLGKRMIVVISEYNILKEAFVTKGIETAGRLDSPMLRFFNPGYPHVKGIIHSDYSEEWKRQRNTALCILRTLGWGRSVNEERITDEAAVLIQELEKMEGRPMNPSHLLGTCVANIICSLLFGERYSRNDSEFQELLKNIDDMLLAFAEEGGADFVPLMRLSPGHRRAVKIICQAGGSLVKFYQNQIAKAKAKYAKDKDGQDFLSLYLRELDAIGEENTHIQQDWMVQLVSDFFMAGTETTATTLMWAMLYMANYQDIQSKVYKEIQSVVDREPTYLKHREQLTYTEATIMEIQRIAALVPIGVFHRAMTDTEIAGYRIPQDTLIWSNLYGILKDEHTFPDPAKLVPERFLNQTEESLQHIENWIPFSMGRRTCLGEQLARQELFLFFSNIIKSFKILPPEGVEQIAFKEVFKFVLKPSEYEVRFIKR